ncbi:MAG: hypothetical protein AAB874_07630 [Patescibacteria group bacterium]
MQTRKSQSGVSGVLITVIIGVLIATVSFFTVFITTQRASVPHPKSNLHLTVPPKPTRKPLPPLPALPSNLLTPQQEATTSAENETVNPGAGLEVTPQPDQIDSEIPVASDSAQ